MTFKPFCAAILSLAIGTPALAQGLTQQQQAEFRRNCTADYTRLCSDFEPNTPEVQACFRQKIKDVSPRCQTTIANFSKAGQGR